MQLAVRHVEYRRHLMGLMCFWVTWVCECFVIGTQMALQLAHHHLDVAHTVHKFKLTSFSLSNCSDLASRLLKLILTLKKGGSIF